MERNYTTNFKILKQHPENHTIWIEELAKSCRLEVQNSTDVKTVSDNDPIFLQSIFGNHRESPLLKIMKSELNQRLEEEEKKHIPVLEDLLCKSCSKNDTLGKRNIRTLTNEQLTNLLLKEGLEALIIPELNTRLCQYQSLGGVNNPRHLYLNIAASNEKTLQPNALRLILFEAARNREILPQTVNAYSQVYKNRVELLNIYRKHSLPTPLPNLSIEEDLLSLKNMNALQLSIITYLEAIFPWLEDSPVAPRMETFGDLGQYIFNCMYEDNPDWIGTLNKNHHYNLKGIKTQNTESSMRKRTND